METWIRRLGKLQDSIENKGLKQTFADQVAVRLPRSSLRRALGDESLSPLECFSRDGYNDVLCRNHALTPNDRVLVLGGYLGESTARWVARYGVSVDVVEPIGDFADKLRRRFQSESRVTVWELAVSKEGEEMRLTPDADATGAFLARPDTPGVTVSSRQFSRFWSELPVRPKLIEMNIEGGEYGVLDDAIDSGVIEEVNTWLIQFHQVAIDSDLNRALLRRSLRKTHSCSFAYDWVWERWDKDLALQE